MPPHGDLNVCKFAKVWAWSVMRRELIQLWVSWSPEVSVFAPICPCSRCPTRAAPESKHLQHKPASWCLWAHAQWSHSWMHKHTSKVRNVCLTWLSKNMQNRRMDTKSVTAFANAIWAYNSTAAKQHSHSICTLSSVTRDMDQRTVGSHTYQRWFSQLRCLLAFAASL